MIYLDNASTMPPFEITINDFSTAAKNFPGNPASLHGLGVSAEQVLENARKYILNKIENMNKIESGNKSDSILYFTSGATESNNLAIIGYLKNFLKKAKESKIITLGIEHPSVLKTLEYVESLGFKVVKIYPKNYKSEKEFLSGILNELDENTIFVSIQSVNNETGYEIDNEYLYKEIKKYKEEIVIHCDHTQGFLKRKASGDIISVSAHKIGGFKGIGGLYVKKGIKIKPLFYGGEQQNGVRPGTQNPIFALSFATAVEFFLKRYDKKKVRNIYNICESGIMEIGGEINSFNNVPDILNFSYKGLKTEVLTNYLSSRSIFVSSGAACAKGAVSGVLTEGFGIERKRAESAIRVSFSPVNTEEEIAEFLLEVKENIKRFCE